MPKKQGRKLFGKTAYLGLQAAKSLSIIRLLADAATAESERNTEFDSLMADTTLCRQDGSLTINSR
ncbi:MAG: hypothetical protein EOP02_01410 [Proteobacteria bacterium]|nr:MAG: hypothetical protein EOP02_01410 [Pseudomonadota bacterium]